MVPHMSARLRHRTAAEFPGGVSDPDCLLRGLCADAAYLSVDVLWTWLYWSGDCTWTSVDDVRRTLGFALLVKVCWEWCRCVRVFV